MNKSDLVATLGDKKSLTEKQAMEIVNLVFNGFSETLKKGGRIEIRNFGIFTVRKYKAYKRMNSKTGKFIKVKPKRLPHFKAGRELKNMVNC
jgi:integration host factor subunit beta